MWRLCGSATATSRALLVSAFVLALLAALPGRPYRPLARRCSARASSTTTHGLVTVAAVGLGVSATLTWLLAWCRPAIQRRFRDQVTIALERHVAGLQAQVVTVAHQERPDYLDRLSVLRDQIFVLDHMYMSVFSTAGWILRLGGHRRAADVDPPEPGAPGALRPADGGHLGVATRRRARGSQEESAQHSRRAQHLYRWPRPRRAPGRCGCWGWGSGSPGTGGRGERGTHPSRARWVSAGVAHPGLDDLRPGVRRGGRLRGLGLDASTPAVLLVLAAGGRLSGYVGATVGEIGFLRGVWLDGSRRLAWLEDYAAAQRSGDLDAARRGSPTGSASTACLRLSRHRPAGARDVDLALPAGAVVASSARTAPASPRW